MIDELEEQLEDKETELAMLKTELEELDKKNNIPGEEGSEIRKRANELVLRISKRISELESEVKKRSEVMKLEMHTASKPNKLRMEGRSKIF